MKKFIPREVVQSLVSQTNIANLIARYVKLKNQNNNLVGLCPFHSEKTPSFSVNPQKQFYHCFGCGIGGNVIDFLMRYQNIDFIQAVEALADFNGVKLDSKKRVVKNQWAYDMNQYAADFFITSLKENERAQKYLQSRKLSDDIIEKYSIGYATNDWEGLKNKLIHSLSGEKKEQQVIKNGLNLGLLSTSKNRVYDKFRDRIIFPIRNISGNIVGFGGRVITSGEPKYLNSPQSIIFSKSNELFGLYEASRRFHKLEQVVVVEGYMDVIALANHKIDYALACLGTAFNENHIKNLIKITRQIVFCFDGDTAGRKAAHQGIIRAIPYLSENFNIQLLLLDDGEDPDSYIQTHSKEAFEKEIAHSQNWAEFLIQNKAKDFDTSFPAQNEQLIYKLSEIYHQLKNPAAQRIFLSYATEFLVVSTDKLAQIFDQSKNQGVQKKINTQSHPYAPDFKIENQQNQTNLINQNQSLKRTKLRNLVLILIYYPELIEQFRNKKRFHQLFEKRFNNKNMSNIFNQTLIYIEPEYLSELKIDEIDKLTEVMTIVEENQNISPSEIMEQLRSHPSFLSFYQPLMNAKDKILILDRWNDDKETDIANDFLDGLIHIIKQHEKKQKLAEFFRKKKNLDAKIEE